jgi:uncharacterized protein YdaU (DUF1376 family)
MNYYPFHIGDYASATRHLSWLEDAAYRRLMDVYYVREEPLPTETRQIYRLVVASTQEQRDAVDVVLEEFFELAADGYRHTRCDAEIHAANTKKDKASQSALKRWSNARNDDSAKPAQCDSNANASKSSCERIANESETPCEGNAPNPNPNPNPKEKQTPATPAGFAEFWQAYPKKVGKGAAEQAWKKHKPSLTDCLTAIALAEKTEAWRKDGGQFIPNPATWLNQRRWEDEHTSATVAAGSSIGGLPRRLMLTDEVAQ